jgi:hypothetical protein
MRWTLRRQVIFHRTKTHQRTAKSCGPGAATLASSWREVSRQRRWQKRPLTGESTKQPLKPLRGESRDVSAVPVVKPVCFLSLVSHTGLRAQSAPGFPCALSSGEGQREYSNSGNSCRENETACHKVSSPAKAGDPVFQRRQCSNRWAAYWIPRIRGV